MDEYSLADAKLAKNNINILSVVPGISEGEYVVVYEYRWRPQPGVSKWQKNYLITRGVMEDRVEWIDTLVNHVLFIRKQLEK